MVKLKTPPVFYRDHTDGWVGWKNYNGPCARSHAIPRVQKKTFVGLYRQLFGQVAGAWNALSMATKNDWTIFSQNNLSVDRYGNAIEIGGYQWFTRLNTLLLQSGQSTISSPPPNDTPGYTPTINVLNTAPPKSIYASIAPAPGSGEAVFWAAALNKPLSQTTNSVGFKTGGYFNSSSSAPYSLTPNSSIANEELLFKYRFLSIDQYGRSAGYVYDSIIPATFP